MRRSTLSFVFVIGWCCGMFVFALTSLVSLARQPNGAEDMCRIMNAYLTEMITTMASRNQDGGGDADTGQPRSESGENVAVPPRLDAPRAHPTPCRPQLEDLGDELPKFNFNR